MTVEYKDSKRIVALSTDIADTATFEDDFSGADNWTDSDSTIIGVNTTTDVLDFKEKDGDFDEVSYYGITALGTDANFTLRLKLNIGTITQTGNTDSVRTLIGISSNNDIPTTTARDEVGIIWRVTDTVNKFYAFTADGIALPNSGTDFATTPSTTGGDGSGNYYVEIIGSSGTYTFKLYSDSSYATLIESETITDAGITGLDNIVIRSSTLTTTNNQARGYIDDVKFYDGATTNKPTNVQDNSLLVEKDTARRYWFSEATPTTFENDFGTTSDWTKVGTTITVNDHVSGKCSINDPANSSSDRVYKSLGATLSDTAWVATCEINISAISGSERAFPVQFSSTTGSYRSSHDSIAIRLGGDLSGSSPSIGMSRNDGGTVIHLTDANSIQVSTGTLYYVKIWRDGSDLKLAVYTNSDYETGQVGSTQTHQSLGSPTGLSNVVIGSDDASTGGVNATVDNLKVYNNVTTTTPATWTMQPTYEDDFSSDNWTDSGSNVDISSGVMNFDIDRTTTDQSSYYQLSSALSDTKWVVRLHDVIVTTKSGGVEVFIGVSSNTSGAQTAQDFIGLNLGDNTANPVLGGVDSDGAVIARLAGDYTYSLSTTYNIEIIRESATSYRIKVFSNSGFDSTALFSQSYTCTATTTGLQYVKFANGQVAGSTENIIGTCSKIEIYNGVTSIN